jgi:outer membrane protein OmpA-like peptidoglycan-associated protein
MVRIGWCIVLTGVGVASCGGPIPAPRTQERLTEAAVLEASQELVLAREAETRAQSAARALAQTPKIAQAPKIVQAPNVGGGPPPDVEERAPGEANEPAENEAATRSRTKEDAAKAMDQVAIAVGSVRVDPRGTVITLPANAFFVADRTTFVPAAAEKLNLVADALRGRKGRAITIEGFTDSQGSEASNRQLSQERAEAIRQYLVVRGLPASDVHARGLGAVRPIGDNGSIAGRARNHRVEILLESSENP